MTTRPRSRRSTLLGPILAALAVVGLAVGSDGITRGAPSTSSSPSTNAVVPDASAARTSRATPFSLLDLPRMSVLPSPYAFPTPTPKPTRKPDIAAGPTTRVATRVVVPALGIDLPVMRQKTRYPPCSVAMYLAMFKQPGRGGPTYLYAHARRGMFLPLLTESKRNDGKAMIGMEVHVYTGDNLKFTYEITRVRRHARDFNPVKAAKGETVWLQTSEGPNASYPKLQVAGKLVSKIEVGHAEAHPRPRPRSC